MLRLITKTFCFLFLIHLFLYGDALFYAEAKQASESKKNVRVRIVKMTKKDIKLLGKDLSHPVEFDVEGIKNALSLINYQEKSFAAWKKRKPIFGTKNRNRFASLIQRALLKIKSNGKLSFSVYKSGKRNSKTAGYLVATDDTLIFKFDTINGTPYIDDFDISAESEADIITKWKLSPRSGQEIYSTKGLLGISSKHKTMIVVPIDDTQSDTMPQKRAYRTKVEKERTRRLPENNIDKRTMIENKLSFLKNLKQKNLITDEAYERKIQDLLDQL